MQIFFFIKMRLLINKSFFISNFALVMSFRKTISWFLFPLTMWYAIGVWFRNVLFTIGIKKQQAMPVTTIGVGNICAGGVGKTPHVEYLLRLLADQYPSALLSRGYRRKTKGFLLDDGSHNATQLGDEPAMVARKFPQVMVAVCEKRVEGVQRLLELEEKKPSLVVLDDVYQHRQIKPTVTILLTEYGKPFYKDRIMPYGDLRESSKARYRADIVIVTKSPEKLNPIEKHNITLDLKLKPYQKLFFSYIHYCDPQPLCDGAALSLAQLDGVLSVTGIAHPDSMLQHIRQYCPVESLSFGDHHSFTKGDLKKIRKAFEQIRGERKIVLTTEKDAVRLPADSELLAGLPIYVLPIEVRIHQNEEYNFDKIISNAVKENVLFLHRMQTTSFDFLW